MKTRCYNPNHKQFKDYGGRGIEVCEEWKDNFKQFAEDMYPKPFKEAQLDRIDNNKGYSKDNCRWVSRLENQRNRRDNFKVIYDGVEQCLRTLCDELALDFTVINTRIRQLEWDVKKALTTPIKKRTTTTVVEEYC